ncbi:MAG: hypothetical protein ABI193_02230 [Minicystis sp.]
MIRAARLLLPLLSLSTLLGLGGAGCGAGEGVHAWSAFLYDPVRHCLGAAAVVDVIAGPDPGGCAEIRCWERVSGDVFVTDATCEAPVDFTDHSADADGPCKEALAAYADQQKGRCAPPVGDAGS